MTPEEYDLFLLKALVTAAKVRYIKARDARQPSASLWNVYARALHKYRLAKREKNNG